MLIIGLGIGREGWTIIKTYPNDWLFLRTSDGKRSKLSALAMQLKCDVFHYRVVNNSEYLLLEANSAGEVKFGYTGEPKFSLIKVSDSLSQAMQINTNHISVDVLKRLNGIEAGDYERIDYLLMKALDPALVSEEVIDKMEMT